MKLPLALGVALAALTAAASAHTGAQIFIRHNSEAAIDANDDGWLTRAEAGAAAERMFARLDRNNDGRLTADDHAMTELDFDFDFDFEPPDVEVEELEGGERRVRVIRRGGAEEAEIREEVERAMADARREMAEARREAAEAVREARHAAREAEQAGREIRHEMVMIHAGPAMAPLPPTPPHAPMFMMLVASSEEADLNGDGALSRDEFRAQQLRFFDASDANGDGRIRFEAPEPPPAPAPPAPPEPPARR